jgi:hypothetical protein
MGRYNMDKTKCCIRDCEGKVRTTGFCNHHYSQWERYGHPLADELSHRRTGHCKANDKTYRSWVSMKKRCTDPNSIGWKNYGGRGITICERWQKVYLNFHEDMGECPDGYTLDRIDNNGNYEPSNCKWSTQLEQSQNKRNIKLTEELVIEARKLQADGMSTKELSDRLGVNYQTMYQAVKGLSWRHLNEERS